MIYFIKYILLVIIMTLLMRSNQLMKLKPSTYSNDSKLITAMMILSFFLLMIHFYYVLIQWSIWFLIHFFRKRYLMKNRKRLIEFYGYKIFKFLMNQVSSGILVSDAIKSMYRIVDDKYLKESLIEVSAYYSKTTNLHEALDMLKQTYAGIEVDTLCMAIEQGIYTGANYETLKKMEQLLFKRYIYQIKLETRWRRKRSILSVLLLCTILILMISIPVILDMMAAFNQIFLY